MSSCGGPRVAEETTPEVEESTEIGETSQPCTEDYIMYFNVSDTGWWETRPGWTSSSALKAMPQYLKVLVNGPKSCQGDRYYFTVEEGPLVANGEYVRNASPLVQGNVSKMAGDKPVLIADSPHTGPASLTMGYEGHSFDYWRATLPGGTRRGVANVAIWGPMTYAGVTKTVVMTADVIAPNRSWKLIIPDFPHDKGKKYNANLKLVWFPVDAPTGTVAWTGDAAENDRYFHLGAGSAGCFTNVRTGEEAEDGTYPYDGDWDKIAGELMKARDGSNLYVGDITMQVPNAKMEEIKAGLIAYADGLPYFWDGEVHRE